MHKLTRNYLHVTNIININGSCWIILRE